MTFEDIGLIIKHIYKILFLYNCSKEKKILQAKSIFN